MKRGPRQIFCDAFVFGLNKDKDSRLWLDNETQLGLWLDNKTSACMLVHRLRKRKTNNLSNIYIILEKRLIINLEKRKMPIFIMAIGKTTTTVKLTSFIQTGVVAM